MLNLVQDIKPISYVKAHITDVVNHVAESRSTLLITQNGDPKAVLIDLETYQQLLNAVNLSKLLSFSDQDLKTGRLNSHEAAKKHFAQTLGRKSHA
jgi:prevent-host-death family protein